MTLSRRLFLLTPLAALACTARDYPGPPRPLSIGAGEPGGPYLAFATRLAAEIAAAEPDLRATPAQTQASVANLRLLGTREVDLALAHADACEAAATAAAPFTDRLPLRALGRIYENYLQIAVPAASPVRRVAELAGRRIAMGAPGSGAAMVADRITTRLNLTPGPQLRLAEAAAALAEGRVDALVWSGGVPTPALEELDIRTPIRLLPLDDVLPALRGAHGPVYEQVSVPSGVYRAPRPIPTIGVANLVVCREELPVEVAAAVTRVLLTRADRLIPQDALGIQFLDPRALISTAAIPLHPGAAGVYRELHG
ncbi:MULTISPECIES: TAXI family TRAP transporter solute-binding subunit [unclassified Crossiella]|uniref:TAXI family TRAP transporter solute-binding subunit n=1 Tax=unclassified Crossiella TaxID=2620835 RepID=UPI001FFEE605|nr:MULTISPECIES: TAXI family TRAP transporter solute-binding subunit [unclassified Crossiella]MCK2242122.1 TAXI family TRAP transporter solute-binding subunit [Crossiella sp. S99.2]MCK2256025.1 TAXI family TRAP transporter solute-binding subunit [Crossiella sp. S99.1]